jgi:tRNA pseudouridine55 synthase
VSAPKSALRSELARTARAATERPIPPAAQRLAGVIVYPKPAGVTSHDVVIEVRRSLGRGEKVGHAGTLDPFATGVLLVLVGPATRTQRLLLTLPKTYRAVARLGYSSDTGDRDGRIERTGRIPGLESLPTGELMQRPPAYSAVKVAGERLYRKARRGEPVEGAPRQVTVHRFDLLRRDGEHATFELECSSGTYVRQLISDLGDAYCEELERTAIGPFTLADADPDRVIPLNDALAFLPERPLAPDELERVRHGVAVAAAQAPEAEAVRLTHGDDLIAIARSRSDVLKPFVVFPA